MGDWFQVLVDTEVTLEEAAATAERGLVWLIQEEILGPEPGDYGLGKPDGYPPGNRFEKAVELSEGYQHLRKLHTNGLQIYIAKDWFLFLGGQGSHIEIECDRCGPLGCYVNMYDLPGFEDALNRPNENIKDVTYTCPRCGYEKRITEWEYHNSLAFGNLAFKFWNWPPFRDDFIQAFEQRLGHQLTLIAGKL